jgi:polyisoprenoid-binding protein YceI
MRDTRFGVADVSRASRRPRRLPLALTVVVTAILLVPPVAASAGVAKPAAAGHAAGSVAGPCTRTVSGFSAAAVERARDLAGAGGIVCFPAGTYSGSLHATVARQTWKLDDAAKLTGSVYITGAGVKLFNGVSVRAGVNRWTASVEIRANDVTVQSVRFLGGGTGVGVYGKDRSRIISNTFKYMLGSAVSIWSEGVGADRTLVRGNRIVQSRTHQVSPITSRGNEGSSHGGVQNNRPIIRKNVIDQGAGDIGWFGIELKQSKNAIVESNTIKGGIVLMSIPETDNATIRYNTFDLRGTPHWGIEVGNAYDAVIDKNTFFGDGPGGVDYAIALNTNPRRTLARWNNATNLRTFFAIAGDGHRVTDNCLKSSVRFVEEFALNGGPDIIFARNRC